MLNELPNSDIRVLYLAAGHTETGGTACAPLVEGHENIQVVDDAINYLAAHANLSAGRPLGTTRTEYDLGQVILVKIDHVLDLVDTIRAINDDYKARCQQWGVDYRDPRYGVCAEVHFNAPSKTAQGSMIIHTQSSRSKVLGNMAAAEMTTAVALPAVHRDNAAQHWSDGTIGYGFINQTTMLALIIECDEMHNPARAAIIGDDSADDIYGIGIARLLMRLAVVGDVTAPSRRGMHIGYGTPVDWAAVEAVRPQALVVFQLADVKADGRYYLFREWGGQPVWAACSHPDGAEFAQFMTNHLQQQVDCGRPLPKGVQFLNEPNLPEESGLPKGSQQAAQKTVAWGMQVVQALRQKWGNQIEIHSPPLSPSHDANSLQFYEWIRPLVEACDVLNVHCYWAGWGGLYSQEGESEAFHYRQVHALFPNKPVFISECGRPAHGTKEYGQELAWYFLHLDDYVRYACPYIWNAPANEWTEWVLQGQPAAAVLAATAPVVKDYAALWGSAVPYNAASPLATYWRGLVDAGKDPGPALAVAQPKAGMEAGFFLRWVVTLEGGTAREYWLKS